ncbi:MAG: flagellar basal body-associated FliL family protein [Planctomycetota bacterium]
MADANDKKQQEDADDIEQQEDSKTEKNDKKVSGGGILPWIIMFVVIVLCGIAGFTLGRFLSGSSTPKTAEHSQEYKSALPQDLRPDDSATDAQKVWYYDLGPIVANLDVPGVTRYVRAVLTLEINPEVDKNKGTDFFNEKKPVLTNWLTIYLLLMKSFSLIPSLKSSRFFLKNSLYSEILDAMCKFLY